MGYVFFMAHVVFIWGVKLSNWKDLEDIDNCILCRPESMEKDFFLTNRKIWQRFVTEL